MRDSNVLALPLKYGYYHLLLYTYNTYTAWISCWRNEDSYANSALVGWPSKFRLFSTGIIWLLAGIFSNLCHSSISDTGEPKERPNYQNKLQQTVCQRLTYLVSNVEFQIWLASTILVSNLAKSQIKSTKESQNFGGQLKSELLVLLLRKELMRRLYSDTILAVCNLNIETPYQRN